MKSTNTKTSKALRRKVASLDSRYGEIGISAVAAALQYTGDAKNRRSAPVSSQPDDRWHADLAA